MILTWNVFHSHHQALNDAKVVIDDLSQGGQTVGGAGCVAMGMKWDRLALFSKHRALSVRNMRGSGCLMTSLRFLPDNLEGIVVLLVVDTHDEHGSVSAGGRDDDSLGTTLQMGLQWSHIKLDMMSHFTHPAQLS